MRPWMLALAVTLSLSGCAHTPSAPRLPIPERPVLPTIQAAEVACLTDETYTRLVQRERLLRAHIETLEQIIKTTH